MVDPSSGGHIDGEQQEVELKAADEEGGHDVADGRLNRAGSKQRLVARHRDTVFAFNDSEAEKGGRTCNHFVWAVIQRRAPA